MFINLMMAEVLVKMKNHQLKQYTKHYHLVLIIKQKHHKNVQMHKIYEI